MTNTRRQVLRLAQLALGLQVLLVVSGAAVRVTGSGLGCPTWPRCTGGSLASTAALGGHGAIEFGNRLLAVGMELVGIALVVAVVRARGPRSWRRLALVQAMVVPLQAVVGGLLVLSGLNRDTVAAPAGSAPATMKIVAETTTAQPERNPRIGCSARPTHE